MKNVRIDIPTILINRIHEITLVALVLWYACSDAWHVSQGDLRGMDFMGFYYAAQRLNHGQSLYFWDPSGKTGAPYVFPPFIAEVLRPLSLLSYDAAYTFWSVLSICCLVLAAIIVISVAHRRFKCIEVCIAILICFKFWPTSMELSFGNVNSLLVFWLALMHLRLIRPGLWPLDTIIGSLTKTWFIGLVGFDLLEKRWRDAVVGAVVFACGITVSFLVLGLEEFRHFFGFTKSFVEQTGGGYLTVGQLNCVLGFARLHFSKNRWCEPFCSEPVVFVLFLLLAYGIVFGGIIYVFRKSPQTHFDRQLRLGLYTCSMLLLLPICDPNYLVLTLPTLWLILGAPESARNPRFFSIQIVALVIYALGTRPALPFIPAALRDSQSFLWLCALWWTNLFAIVVLSRSKAATVLTPQASVAEL
jgi:hypothetical protein